MPLSGDLKARVLSAVVAVPLVVLLIWLGVNTTAALVAAASVVGIYEFYHLGQGRTRLLLALGLAGGILFTVDASLGGSFTFPLFTGAVIVPLIALLFQPQQERAPRDWAWTVAGLFLVGWTLSLAVLLRQQDQGREWVLTALVLTFGVDTGAFFFGRAFGRRKLAPSISPGKTWEGAVAGLLVGAGAAVAVAAGFDLDTGVWDAIVLGLLVGVFSQLGDMAESVVKRAAGAKDAGRLIPGHGGMLDRLDSLIPAIAVVYFFLQYLGR